MRPIAHSTHATRRRGITLMESSVAMFVVAIAVTLVAQLVRTSAQQRHAVDRRLIASQEAANVLEELRCRPWAELTADSAAQLRLSKLADSALSNGQLSVVVSDESEPRPGRRIDVRVTWSHVAGATQQSVALSTWRFAP